MRLLAAILLVGVAAPLAGAATPTRRRVHIPAGEYRPLYGEKGVKVEAFNIDRDPVTRAEFLGWQGKPSAAGDARRPMTSVSWTEANAYCAAKGGRLPTLAEWELVAAASRAKRNAASDAAFVQALVSTYASRSAEPGDIHGAASNFYGVRGMHDLAWEWVADPNPTLAAKHHSTIHHAHGSAASHDMTCAGSALGAADPRDYPAFLRAAVRSGLTESTRMSTLGFRCAA